MHAWIFATAIPYDTVQTRLLDSRLVYACLTIALIWTAYDLRPDSFVRDVAIS